MKYSSEALFKPRARLLLQLGDQLIKNENIAVLELVKNSYDADAKNVTVKMSNVEDKGRGIIEILDDGIGMDENVITNAWLEPGSDFKEKLFKSNKRTPKYNRLPIGEKGIGRFGVHKLGTQIELITRKKDQNEIVVKIDWEEFAKNKYLDKAKIEVITRTPEYFLRSRHGTRIIIKNLRTEWDRRMVRDLYKSIFTLSSPFKTIDHFTVDFKIDKKKWIEDFISWNEIENYSLYYFNVKIKGSEIIDFTYKFTPFKELDKLTSKTITIDSEFVKENQVMEVASQEDKKKKVIIDLEKFKIGEIGFEGYIFDRDIKLLSFIEEVKIKQIKRYLDENGGIRVYRDHLRVNEYGEKGNDWLNLDLRRVNVPSRRISNNIILSIINLKREDSSDLIEKTNREGFVENEAYNEFKAAILYNISLVEKLRQVDKAELRDKYHYSEQEEPVLHLTNQLRIYVEKNIKEEPIREKIVKYIIGIENDYEEINKTLLTSAGAGLTLGIGIHEIEKLIKELVLVVKAENTPDKIRDMTQNLQTTVNNYLDLLKQKDKGIYPIKDLIKSALFNIEYRTKIHKIEIIPAYKNLVDNPMIECPRRFFLSAVLNILDNSVYWLDKKHRNLDKVNQAFKKKIYIDLVNKKSIITLIIADNGNGFHLPTNQITKPFITSKEEGMGLGLHITSQIMKTMDATLLFPDKGDFEIPDEFMKGATVALQFNQK